MVETKRRLIAAHACALVAFMAAGCTSTRRQIRTELSEETNKLIKKEGVIIENLDIKDFPVSFSKDLPKCSPLNPVELQKGLFGEVINEKVSLAGPGQWWYALSVQNETEHVLRLEKTVIKLVDPAGVAYDPLQAGDIFDQLSARRSCRTTAEMKPVAASLKLLGRKAELVPKFREQFWLAFALPSPPAPGKWTLSIYDFPVKVDQSGAATKTTRFDFSMRARNFRETVKRASDGTEQVLSKVEVQ